MDCLVPLTLFALAVTGIVLLLYYFLRPAFFEGGGEAADIRYIAVALMVVVLVPISLAQMYVLGKSCALFITPGIR